MEIAGDAVERAVVQLIARVKALEDELVAGGVVDAGAMRARVERYLAALGFPGNGGVAS